MIDNFDSIDASDTDAGVVFAVKVSAGARTNEIRGLHDGALKVSVRQVAERGKANAAVIDLLAAALGVAKSQIQVTAGHKTSNKKIHVNELNAVELARRLSR